MTISADLPIVTLARAASILLLLSLAILPGPAFARPRSAGEETRLSHCIRHAAGGRVWLERTLWGLRDKEGGWVGAEIANADGSHDLGPLQINSWWVPRIARLTGREETQVRRWLIEDACFNVSTARWIFLSELRAVGDYWSAIGRYHSPTKWRAQGYARGVADRLEARFGRELFVQHSEASGP